MEIIVFITHYVLLPLVSLIGTLSWHMYIKLEKRVDSLENRTNITEKDVIEIRVAIRKDIEYIKDDIKEIKELLINK